MATNVKDVFALFIEIHEAQGSLSAQVKICLLKY